MENNIIFNHKIAKNVAKTIIETKSYIVNFNEEKSKWIKLPDGRIIPCYCNCRYINSKASSTKKIDNYFLEMIENRFPGVEIIIGLETAGISWASKIASSLNLPFAYIRSKPKGYGMGKLVECNPDKKLKAVIIDDIFFTGKAISHAVDAIERELGNPIMGVGVIVNLSSLNENHNSESFKKSVPISALTDYFFILNELKKKKMINENQFSELTNFYQNYKINSF